MFDFIFEERVSRYIFRGQSDPGIEPPFLLGLSQYLDTNEIVLHQRYKDGNRSSKIHLSPSDWKQMFELMKPYLDNQL